MAEETLKAGDIVELKSGSPKMTIIFIAESNAYCTWYDTNTHTWRESVKFPLIILKSTSAPGGY